MLAGRSSIIYVNISFDKSLVDKIPKKYNGLVKTAIVIYVHERDFVLLTVTIIENQHLMPGIK